MSVGIGFGMKVLGADAVFSPPIPVLGHYAIAGAVTSSWCNSTLTGNSMAMPGLNADLAYSMGGALLGGMLGNYFTGR